MAKNETEPKKLPIWAIKIIGSIQDFGNELETGIEAGNTYKKETIIMYKRIADMISQRAEKIKNLADKLKEN